MRRLPPRPQRISASDAGVRRAGRWAAGICAAALALALAAALGLAPPAPARAQSAREPTAADRDAARRLVELGNQKIALKDYEGALKDYAGADAIMGVPTTGMKVVDALVALARLVEAHEVLLRVARHPKTPEEPAPFTAARDRAAQLVAELEERIPTVSLAFVTAAGPLPPDTALAVEIDGQPVPRAALALSRKVNPGKHAIAASAPGYRPAMQSFEVAERDRRSLEVVLDPLQAVLVPADAGVEAAPGGEPSDAGVPDADADAGELDAGDTTPVVPPAPDAGEWEEAAVPPAPPPVAPRPAVAPASAGHELLTSTREERWASAAPFVHVGLGTALVGVVTGAVTGGLSLWYANQARDLCPTETTCSAAAQPHIDKGTALAHASTAGFAVGGLGLAIGLGALFYYAAGDAPEPPVPKAARVRAVLGPGGVGVAAQF
ncbi:MAG: hypothetical protein HY744_10735 [Deltaproteobacteria bacterium]|nr:hypothetical protein [Deltaproteobacteria bacterium]